METTDYLNDYYSAYDENSRLLSRHGQVEFLTTVKYVEKYLSEGAKILEIGAGTGRYSHYFARNGYNVDAVELIPHNIEIFKENTRPDEKVTVTEGNACSMPFIPDNTYDITLLLGPMYHLYTEADRLAALSEAIRVTKKGGVIFAAYCNSDATAYHFGFFKGGFKNEKYLALINPDTFKLDSTPEEVFVLYRREDIDGLMKSFDTERLHYIGTDMLTRFISEAVDAMDDEMFGMYMKHHFCVCERPDMVGATDHMLDIFRKR